MKKARTPEYFVGNIMAIASSREAKVYEKIVEIMLISSLICRQIYRNQAKSPKMINLTLHEKNTCSAWPQLKFIRYS